MTKLEEAVLWMLKRDLETPYDDGFDSYRRSLIDEIMDEIASREVANGQG